MRCITSARFNMLATVLKRGVIKSTGTANQGHYETTQDPDTGSISRVWVPDEPNVLPENAGDEGEFELPCQVRATLDAGYRSPANLEEYDETYNITEYAKIHFSSRYDLTREDRITNVRTKGNKIVWAEEESNSAPTVFDIVGVSPVVNPFGRHTENVAVLKRLPVQHGG